MVSVGGGGVETTYYHNLDAQASNVTMSLDGTCANAEKAGAGVADKPHIMIILDGTFVNM